MVDHWSLINDQWSAVQECRSRKTSFFVRLVFRPGTLDFPVSWKAYISAIVQKGVHLSLQHRNDNQWLLSPEERIFQPQSKQWQSAVPWKTISRPRTKRFQSSERQMVWPRAKDGWSVSPEPRNWMAPSSFMWLIFRPRARNDNQLFQSPEAGGLAFLCSLYSLAFRAR